MHVVLMVKMSGLLNTISYYSSTINNSSIEEDSIALATAAVLLPQDQGYSTLWPCRVPGQQYLPVPPPSSYSRVHTLRSDSNLPNGALLYSSKGIK